MKALVAVALLLVLTAGYAYGQGSGPNTWQPFVRQAANIKGDVLILDVGSLSYQGNHPMFPPFNEDGCADACARTPGCNAFTFCTRKEGCGTGCKAYTEQHPQLSVAKGPNDNPTIPNPAWRNLTTIEGFGPWGVTGNCKYVCQSDGSWPCSPGDVWPYGLCTLKKLSNPDKPEFWSTNADEGWTSGYAQLPTQCAGLPLRTCSRCLRSRDPTGCLSCANKYKVALLEGAYSNVLTRADGCSSCYDLRDPSKCAACLADSNAPCAKCALQQLDAGRSMDVASCIDCVQKHGAQFEPSCTSCGALGAQQHQVKQCMACVGTMAPLACNSTDYRPGCWNPSTASYACVTCASRANKFGTCLACMQRSPYSADCEACAGLDAGKQQQCYACAKGAAQAGSPCSDCFSANQDSSQQQQECLSKLSGSKNSSGNGR